MTDMERLLAALDHIRRLYPEKREGNLDAAHYALSQIREAVRMVTVKEQSTKPVTSNATV